MSEIRFRHQKYTYERPFTHPRHQWAICGPQAAIHLHVSVSEEYGDSAGLEIHYFSPPEYMQDSAPSHTDCPFAGGRCWHDGTSLYATETLWPMVRSMLGSGDHDAIFRVLEGEYRSRFAPVPRGDAQ